MANKNYTECPKCGKTASRDGIKEEFGYRNMGNGKIIPQSWCKECRSKRSNIIVKIF